ncbi:LuxR C-terminal-related transcriptional regulator [Sphingomonas sp. Leaf67]|uniref:LuxR C-terminal-related transcriptional regulator n=1 Tax=Sphingomonas sp. Leaf67 TaxID=1736230 RepID=UPI0009EA929B|nr:LuxR C-terminal-related transcriptional regulator [Sphingomonas sp. Leaf67]
MEVSPDRPGQSLAKDVAPTGEDTKKPSFRVAQLSERQLSYLRLVYQHRSSKEIAALTGVSSRAVDKQLLKANNLLGTNSRVDAARLVADYDGGVEPLPPAISPPSEERLFPLPLPLPTTGAAANMLTWKQAAIWSVIIAIVTPIGLTVAGMVILTLTFLFGLKLR